MVRSRGRAHNDGMAFDGVVSGGFDDFAPKDVSQGGFEYEKRIVVPKDGNQLHVSFMEIPPGRSAFPYHWHEAVTESFVILSGEGTVRTPEGERMLGPGDVIVFPPGPPGAHRITNTGEVPLRYVDIDSTAYPDVCVYPDSGKVGWHSRHEVGGYFRGGDAVDYYDGEPDA